VPAAEWRELEAGLRQRVKALNRFIHDIYHGQSIVKAGIIRPSRSSATRSTGPRCRASTWRTTSTRTSPG